MESMGVFLCHHGDRIDGCVVTNQNQTEGVSHLDFTWTPKNSYQSREITSIFKGEIITRVTYLFVRPLCWCYFIPFTTAGRGPSCRLSNLCWNFLINQFLIATSLVNASPPRKVKICLARWPLVKYTQDTRCLYGVFSYICQSFTP